MDNISPWRKRHLLERIRLLRNILPPMLAAFVIFYQLIVARPLEAWGGHLAHYTVEIAFYSLSGPVATWLTLIWIEGRLEEQELLEQKIQMQTKQLANLLKGSIDAIISLDLQNQIMSWNNGAVNIFGYSEMETLGHSLADIIPNVAGFVSRAELQRNTQDVEINEIKKDGQNTTVNLTYTTGQEEDETLGSKLLILRDVTLRRERDSILEEERARIARDLHDSVAQTLYFISLKADMLQQVEHLSARNRETLHDIGEKTRSVIREIRRTIFALTPLDWNHKNFYDTLSEFIEGFAKQMNWRTEFSFDDQTAIPANLEPAIYRIVREALNNVAKHADASKVVVMINKVKDQSKFYINIQDNGIGFEPLQADKPGFGIIQMQQRVATLQGNMKINSTHGKGTSLEVYIPILNGHSS